ncbi:hypothetical protein BH10PLA1_BH10PLA1_00270 [soil metagenome]
MNELISAGDKGSGSLVRVAGGLGIAAVVLGLSIFLGSCAGFEGALKLALLPLALGAAGVVLSILGAVLQVNSQDTHVMAALFPCVLGVIGGLVETAAWMQWNVFYK